MPVKKPTLQKFGDNVRARREAQDLSEAQHAEPSIPMKENPTQIVRSGYAIFTRTLFQGIVPGCYEDDHPAIFATELEAQHEIADNLLTRIRQFLDGERDFEDAITTDEFVLPVVIRSDGSVAIKD